MSTPPLFPMPGPGGPSVTPAPLVHGRDNIRAILWALVSVVAASLMSLAVRGVVEELDSRMVVMFRAGISSMAVIMLLIFASSLRRKLRFSKPKTHIIRGALIGISTNLGFYTLAHIPLATATVLFFTAPIFATVISALFHGETVGPRRIIAVLAGFCGALVILRPGFETFHPAMLAALASSALFAIALTLSRGLANADGPFSTYFSSVLITSLVTFPLAVPVWDSPSSSLAWIAIAIVILASAVRNIADLQAYRFGEASILAPVAYLRLVLIGTGAWIIFGESIDIPTWIGAAIIISSTLYIALREAKLRSEE